MRANFMRFEIYVFQRPLNDPDPAVEWRSRRRDDTVEMEGWIAGFERDKEEQQTAREGIE